MAQSLSDGPTLVLGATGALGRAMTPALAARGWPMVGGARSGADHSVDVRDVSALEALLDHVDPVLIINCAAIVDLNVCDREPAQAYAVNARPVAALARWCAGRQRKLVQVSTDQFFYGADDPRARHDEDAPVRLAHEYARTKYAGEAFAATAPGALIIRTNMASATPGRGKASIAAWALANIAARAPMTLFDDYFCSTLDAPTLSEAVLDLVADGAHGLFNVAASQVSSKLEFVEALAAALDVRLDWVERGSAAVLGPDRATRIGLNVARAEHRLGRALPGLTEVACNFVQQWRHAHALES